MCMRGTYSIERATALAEQLGVTFSASGGASEPGVSLKRSDKGSPWSLCRRPWTVMHFTANGRALPIQPLFLPKTPSGI